MTVQSADHPNPFNYLNISVLKVWAKKIATFVEDKIASYKESKGGPNWVTKATLYRYRYPGGQMAFSRFPSHVRQCIIFSIFGLNDILSKIRPHADCTVLYGSKAIIVPINNFIQMNYGFFLDVYSSQNFYNFVADSENHHSINRLTKMLGEWQFVAIDSSNKEFAYTCPFLDFDFPNIILFERSKNKSENLQSLLIEAVSEIKTIYNVFKKARKTLKNESNIKNSLKTYYNEHMNDFHFVKEKYLNNDYLYSLNNEGVIRRDFCGQLLVSIIDDHDFRSIGAQNLYKRMLKIEKTTKNN
jgi:hypothetical protein